LAPTTKTIAAAVTETPARDTTGRWAAPKRIAVATFATWKPSFIPARRTRRKTAESAPQRRMSSSTTPPWNAVAAPAAKETVEDEVKASGKRDRNTSLKSDTAVPVPRPTSTAGVRMDDSRRAASLLRPSASSRKTGASRPTRGAQTRPIQAKSAENSVTWIPCANRTTGSGIDADFRRRSPSMKGAKKGVVAT